MAGALTGADAALGVNIKNGVQMALDKHNAANPGCQIDLKTFDTEGDPQKATAIAPQIVDDATIIGLVGPAFSGETKATGGVFNQAGLVAATASATNVTLSEQGWKTFFRGLANDGVQGPSVANYMKTTLGDKKVCVVDDSTDYGTGLAQAVRNTLGPVSDASCSISVKKGDKDFSAAVTQVKGASPDSVFYSGYYAEAAPFVQQLRDAGFTGRFVSADGTKDPEFVKQAGESSKDAVLSCPCGPASTPTAPRRLGSRTGATRPRARRCAVTERMLSSIADEKTSLTRCRTQVPVDVRTRRVEWSRPPASGSTRHSPSSSRQARETSSGMRTDADMAGV